jgi:hypothetical protein
MTGVERARVEEGVGRVVELLGEIQDGGGGGGGGGDG